MPESRPNPAASETDEAVQSPTSFFGQDLGPVLVGACDGRLSDLHWFRTTWQRGGALTGYGKYLDDDQRIRDVVVKLPVPPQEWRWMQRLQADQHDAGEVTPKLYASGCTLNGYDLVWVVMERLSHGPLNGSWDGAEAGLLVEAVGRFYAASAHYPVNTGPREEAWTEILKRARQAVHQHEIREEQRWNKAIKALQKKLKHLMKAWNEREVEHWCHGDLHFGNAMTREAPPQGPALLFDFAEIHAGHWIEDAVYFEHLFWARPDRFNGLNVVKAIARQRKEHGLKVDPQWPHLANIRRALIAASAPAFLHNEGDPMHVHAALGVLESTLSHLN